ncbi:MAG: nucleotidyltransferase family protein [Actinomycetota bacterium]
MDDLPVQDILKIASKHGARDIRIFGSYARGDATEQSDLDILVTLPPEATLLSLIAIEQELIEHLGFPVEVVTEAELHPRLRERILAEAKPLIAA